MTAPRRRDRAARLGLHIPADLRDRQAQASDPAQSVWVSANAGSGKTHVLTQRVIRLLLGGVPPSHILCITFTKAAAAQMATRVFERLSGWATLSDDKLRAAIVETGAPPPRPEELVRARRLFTRTVETPGGLKIQTIHAFCERLLHLFPFEANVPARFEVADDLRAGEMLSLAKRAAIAAAQGGSGPAGAALSLVADIAGASTLERVIGETMPRRGKRQPLSTPDPQNTLGTVLGGDKRFGSADAIREAMIVEGLSTERMAAIAAWLAVSATANDREQANRFAATLAARREGALLSLQVETYLPIFFTDVGKPRKTIVSAKAAAGSPGLKDEVGDEQGRLGGLVEQLKIAETVERTAALLLLVDDIVERYRHAKIAHGLLDFDDLIERTLLLLQRAEAGWVMHKLDKGIDHILVDEAQDTSEAQWQILERLTEDFASGAGARGSERSFFVVGDDKQSIFSFQGAAPHMFDTMRSAFERRFKNGSKPFERVRLQSSFRSANGILGIVDDLFGHGAHGDGLVRPPDIWPSHDGIKAHLPALVEIWPPATAAAAPDPAEWTIPLDALSQQDPAAIVAERVAAKIGTMLAAATCAYVHDEAGRRAVRAGDILILVRTRNNFFEAVIRALKRARVPVAGADRLDVANHIAVLDLAAAGRAALLPADDLTLACVLKSPLFGFSDAELTELAATRAGSLMRALGASPSVRAQAAHRQVLAWGERAATTTPFAFYSEMLGRDGGRRAMEQRLGPEAHDAIDEFLRLALLHEQMGAPALGSFLAEVQALDTTVKRDMEGPGNLVRVMTVHAAKGLEAKVVFLPDTCGVPAPSLDPVVFDLNKDTGAAPLLAWSPRKAEDAAAVAAARARDRAATLHEYRRLFYVALTRAEEQLFIAGFHGPRPPPPESWSAMVEAAFAESNFVDVPAPWSSDDTVRRLVTQGEGEPAAFASEPAAQSPLPMTPPWLHQTVPSAPSRPVLRPSRLGAEPGPDRRDGLLYGAAVHELLELLPSRPADDWVAAAGAFLEARSDNYPARMHAGILADVLGVLRTPALAALFGPGSRAELTVTGQLATPNGDHRVINGKVDRLAISGDVVLVTDFKTGKANEEATARYLRQIALYRKVLMPLWPARALRGLLVWTRGPVIVEPNEDELDAAAAAALALP